MTTETIPALLRDGGDPAVRPQDDLFRHVNGTWLREHVIPSDRSADGEFLRLRDLSEERVRDIIQDAAEHAEDAAPGEDAPAGADATRAAARKIGDLYAAFMDEAAIESAGVAPLEADLAPLRAATTRDELALALTDRALRGVRSLVGLGVGADINDPENYTFYAAQSGIGLPDESYYREPDNAEIREKYRAHLARMLRLGGLLGEDTDDTEDTEDAAKDAAARVYGVEEKIAAAHWDRVKRRDAVARNNPMTFTQLAEQAPGYPWLAVRDRIAQFGDIDAALLENLIVMHPSAVTEAARVWAASDLEDLRLWAMWNVLDSRAALLNSEIVEADFDFQSRTLLGVPELKERWKHGVALVEDALGEEVGALYVQRHFPPEHKERMDRLVADLVEAYRDSITGLDWMGPETRAKALDKLAAFTPKIGYPVRWRDHSELEIPAGDVVAAAANAAAWTERRDLRRLGGPVDRAEWFMTPQTVNAYYNPPMNEIVFPAAILQPPFFDPEGDPAANYGGIGAVIGHEIGHGFDDQGSRYDGTGTLRDWWTSQDREEFERRTASLIAQYDALSPAQLDGSHHVNGSLTIGENIGDLGGLSIALKAYELALQREGYAGLADAPVVDGLTATQRLFVSWARIWRDKARDERVIQLLSIDPHSPDEFRCNQIVRNIDAFHDAFGTSADDELWLAPEERVTIW